MNSNNRIAATLYSLGDTVCLRNISINTLHKGDDDDDDNNNNNNNNNAVSLEQSVFLAIIFSQVVLISTNMDVKLRQ